MRSRYFLAVAALAAAQSSSGEVTVFVDGQPLTNFEKIEIVAGDSATPDPVDPIPDPVDPPPGTDPNTPPLPDGCPTPEGLTVLEEPIPNVMTTFKIMRNQAVALSFDQQHFSSGKGQIQFAENTQGPSPLKWAVISSCPGDFTVTPGCSRNSMNDRLLVDFTGRYQGDSRICSLEEGQTYWFNIRHFDMATGQDTCRRGEVCALYVRP